MAGLGEPFGRQLGVGVAGVEQVPQVEPEVWLQQLAALVDVGPEQRLGVVELAPHVDVLRALAGEHEDHRALGRLVHAGRRALRVA